MTRNNDLRRFALRTLMALALTAIPAAFLAQTAVAQNAPAARTASDPYASSDTDTLFRGCGAATRSNSNFLRARSAASMDPFQDTATMGTRPR